MSKGGYVVKCFAYSGSNHKNSLTKKFIIDLLNTLSIQLEEDISIDIYDPLMINLQECNGCCNCFLCGECFINDDILLIKKSLLSSDIIILGSPVYLWGVTSSMKKVIDRLAHWSHLFKLIGKRGICISCSSNNGNEKVNDYLKLVLETWGISVLSEISLQSAFLTNTSIYDSIVNAEAMKLVQSLQSNNYKISSRQERVFDSMKSEISKYDVNSFEYTFWKNSNYFAYDNFSNLYHDKRMNNE